MSRVEIGKGEKKMKNKFKTLIAFTVIPLTLLGCTAITDETEPEEQEVVQEEVQISNIEVNVSSGITEAVETVDGAVVSIINLRENNFNSWSNF